MDACVCACLCMYAFIHSCMYVCVCMCVYVNVYLPIGWAVLGRCAGVANRFSRGRPPGSSLYQTTHCRSGYDALGQEGVSCVCVYVCVHVCVHVCVSDGCVVL